MKYTVCTKWEKSNICYKHVRVCSAKTYHAHGIAKRNQFERWIPLTQIGTQSDVTIHPANDRYRKTFRLCNLGTNYYVPLCTISG